nr:peptidylprolyl isomerase [Lachnospiraceae bacterium]
MKRFRTAAPAVLLALVLLLTACGGGSQDPTVESGSGTTAAKSTAMFQTTAALAYVQTVDLDAVVIQSEHFSFTAGEMLYLIASISSNLAYYGADTTISLKEQAFPSETGKTWFDVVIDESLSYAEEQLLYCEVALAKGFQTDQANEDDLNDMKKLAEENAASMSWDLETYFQQFFGTNIRWKDIEGVFRKGFLSQKVRDELLATEYTDEEIEKEYQENTKKYALVDYYVVDLNDGEAIPDEVIEAAKTALGSASGAEVFRQAVQEFLQAVKTPADIEAAGGIGAYTDNYLKTATRTGIGYSESELYDWAFAEDTEEGDILLVENEQTSSSYAYCLLKKPYKDMTVTVDIRHILFKTGTPYATQEEARAMADKVYQEWVDGGASEEKFIELCAEYSADGNAEDGGIYTDVYEGQMVQTFNDWCFDEARQPGDHGIVDTEYGSHMMYFIGSNTKWETAVINGLLSRDYDALMEQQKALTPVQTDRELANQINW